MGFPQALLSVVLIIGNTFGCISTTCAGCCHLLSCCDAIENAPADRIVLTKKHATKYAGATPAERLTKVFLRADRSS